MYRLTIILKDFVEKKHIVFLRTATIRLCDFVRRVEKVGG